jgi:hypothetical protein
VDKTPLVTSNHEIEGAVVSALSRAQIPVTAVDWHWVPQLEEWQLIVVTSLFDAKGPREAYRKILDALSEAGIYQTIPIRKLFVKSPKDPAAQQLVQELKLMTEGSIHIMQDARQNGRPRYSVVFAPYIGGGGAIPSKRLSGDDDLREFLEKRLGIHSYLVSGALSEIQQKGSASIQHVQLNLRRAKKLNLAA